jgi:phosphatidylglycerol:prolipoprotein diacylglycerol transferase
MHLLSYIIWSPNPNIFTIPVLDHPIRWYGLLFALGFILSQQVMIWIFKKEGKDEKHVEKLTVYMVLATIIGARLGHCLFYDPGYYLSNPLAILKIWEGGLASHGGAIGIIISLYLFSKKYPYSFFWIVDRIAIVAVLTGALIRTGNFMNSEMEGLETNANYGVVYAGFAKEFISTDEDVASVDFVRNEEVKAPVGKAPLIAVIEYKEGVKFDFAKQQVVEGRLRQGLNGYDEVRQHIDFGGGTLNYTTYQKDGTTFVNIYGIGKVRHAAQLYEAFYCVILMILFFWFWHKKRTVLPAGFNFSMFLILLWSARFVDEYFKMNQVGFEENMSLNMGQWLSIPMTAIGVILMIWIYVRKDSPRMEN